MLTHVKVTAKELQKIQPEVITGELSDESMTRLIDYAYSLCIKFTYGKIQEAEDLAQDCALKFWDTYVSRKNYDPAKSESISTLYVKVIRGVAMNFNDRCKKKKASSLDQLMQGDDDSKIDIPDEQAELPLVALEMEEILSHFEGRDREWMELKMDGLTDEEIAAKYPKDDGTPLTRQAVNARMQELKERFLKLSGLK